MQALRIFLTIFLAQVVWVGAQEWTRFRGPNGQGQGKIESLPLEITPVDYKWVVKLEGFGHSSPVLWGERLFITATNSENQEGSQRFVLCFDSMNGEKLWEWEDPLATHNLHKFNNFASSTPTVDGDRVYCVWGSGQTTQAIALTHSGELVWRKEWPGFTSDHGQGSSPVLVEGVLVFHTDAKDDYKSYVVGLDPATGELLWQLERITPADDKKHFTAYNTPISVNYGGKETVVALQSNDGWKGIDPTSGEIIWSAPGGYSFRSVGSVAASGPYLFASFGSGGGGKQASLIEVSPAEVKVAYSLGIKDGLSYVPTPIVHEGLLFLWADGGILTCRDLETGEEKYRQRVGGNYFSSPILVNGKLVCGSLHGDLVIVEASDQFKVLGRSRLISGMHATPAVANGCLFFRTDTHLLSVCGKAQKN